jgi:hypothetical protein
MLIRFRLPAHGEEEAYQDWHDAGSTRRYGRDERNYICMIIHGHKSGEMYIAKIADALGDK